MFSAVVKNLCRAVPRKNYALPTMQSAFSTGQVVEERLQKMSENNKKLTESYGVIKGDFPKEEYDAIRRRRLVYRAKQRGWLEADILVGSWARENVPRLNNEELDQLETILQEETIDLFNFVSGKDALPEHLVNLPVMKELMQFAKQTKIDDPESYAALKQRNNLI